MADINKVVVRGSAAGFAQEILAGRHPLTADEPVAAGLARTPHTGGTPALEAAALCVAKNSSHACSTSTRNLWRWTTETIRRRGWPRC
jgi:hypothetical protein